MQTPVDEIRRNSWLFDEFLTETKLRRHFREFSRHVLFWTARTFGDKFLDDKKNDKKDDSYDNAYNVGNNGDDYDDDDD